ncbi:spectinomycin phosphotransferase [Thermosporothrix hazakensis]|jgi:spectinomycin phosphotransferase|uniref:Spectinomycin phosphotransferase n=1 Tax=Thermosporothrix hazakensis TaxID=644383 RepID=A0A326U910_THEHA|nr:aminoglycoside phosphotransferase family protein [Thermosporothrix hazakensis]PZW32676.1 spectinomycin phosphotransferase [Thermosporothrix hazakensis]GCE50029.1 spectinomycin phosphotransferase [Thermosporothrix hazakensis]
MREQPALTETQLLSCLQEQYGITPVSLEYLPVGLDTNAGKYRVESKQGVSYLLKVRTGALYKPSCVVPAVLQKQGISAVVAPCPTSDNTLWTTIEGWTLMLYPFLDGDTSWTGITDDQWRETGRIFSQIHRVSLSPDITASLRRETFDPTAYARWLRTFVVQKLHTSDSPAAHAFRASWKLHQVAIERAINAMETLATALQQQALPLVLCHADLHPANLLRDRSGRVFVLDWDEVMLAPKERDFIFIEHAGSPFFQGYGMMPINWAALTYYRYERVIQDVIECADEVFFRDDLSEQSKAEAASLFHAVLAKGGEIEAALEAAAHLPSELSL